MSEMERWECPHCDEIIERPGPTSLAIARADHMHTDHPEIPDIEKYEWTCPECGEYLSRATDGNLTFARTGHLLYKHHKKPDGTPISERSLLTGYSQERIETSMQPGDGEVQPFWPFTDEARKFMKDLHFRWYEKEQQ